MIYVAIYDRGVGKIRGVASGEDAKDIEQLMSSRGMPDHTYTTRVIDTPQFELLLSGHKAYPEIPSPLGRLVKFRTI